jgi:putative endonuclease
MKKQYKFYVYIITNYTKTVLYVGVTNNLARRLYEHQNHVYAGAFSARYKCYYLVYYEEYQHVKTAIAREKEIKGWRREKKENLIKTLNPEWQFLNEDFE